MCCEKSVWPDSFNTVHHRTDQDSSPVSSFIVCNVAKSDEIL